MMLRPATSFIGRSDGEREEGDVPLWITGLRSHSISGFPIVPYQTLSMSDIPDRRFCMHKCWGSPRFPHALKKK
ncbi:unnamed protein product [Victoria cruziana]